MIGTWIGSYQIVEEVGRGGMATVYRAVQRNTDRNVAIKIIHRSIATDPRTVERFIREARLISKLEHPHILPVYDYDGTHEPPYIVMRFLPTGTLKDVMQRGQLPLAEVVYLINQIASALDYAHRQGVVHRDIKPSNILIDAEGNAFLTDFGIARMLESTDSNLTGTGVAVGTSGYMSPEQGMGMPIDGRADIYSLGIMAYEMLTGRVPFQAETPMAVILKHISDPVPNATTLNGELPSDIDALFAKALAKQASDRYASPMEFARALTQLLGAASAANTNPATLQSIAAAVIAEREAVRKSGVVPIPSSSSPTPKPRSTDPRGTATRPVPPGMEGTTTGSLPGTRSNRGLVIGLIAVAAVVLIGISAFVVSSLNKANTDATVTANAMSIILAEAQTATAVQATQAIANVTGTAVAALGTPNEDASSTVNPSRTNNAPDATNTHINGGALDATEALLPTATYTASSTPQPTDTSTPTLPPLDVQIENLSQNGATKQLVITLHVNQPALIKEYRFDVLSASGQEVRSVTLPAPLDGAVTIPIDDLPSGQYIVRVVAVPIVGLPIQSRNVSIVIVQTPMPSATDTATFTATITYTPSDTPTNTPTFTPTFTPTPTATITPSATPTLPVALTITGVQYVPDTNQFVIAIQAQTEDLIARYRVEFINASGAIVNEAAFVTPPYDQISVDAGNLPGGNYRITVRAFSESLQQLASNTFRYTYAPPTATPTPTSLPTDTPTPTDIPPVVPPTFTPIAVAPTEVPTEVASVPTVGPDQPPKVAGSMPYLNDMEAADSIDQWDYNRDTWALRTDSGNTTLTSTGGEKDLAIVMGKASPEWATSDNPNLVINYKVSLVDNGAITRTIFRYSDKGYYVLQMNAGSLILSRGNSRDLARNSVRIVQRVSGLPITTGPYYQITIWTDASRVFIYVDRQLRLQYEDTEDVLPSGQIILQPLSAGKRLRFDDMKIQRPLSVSTHFQTSDFPNDYERSTTEGIDLRTDSSSNSYISLQTGEVKPKLDSWPADMLFSCRINAQINAPFEIRLRDSTQGAYVFEFAVGQLTLSTVDASGTKTLVRKYTNYFSPGRFFVFTVEMLGNEIRVYDEGVDKPFSDVVANAPPTGGVKFSALNSGSFFIDDCLYAEQVKSPTEDGAWAFERVRQIESSPKNYLLDYWNEDFSPGDELRTNAWWMDGRRAPGKFTRNRDRTDKEHTTYLELVYAADASWRMFADKPTFRLFGSGLRPDFYDSSDIYLKVDVRLPAIDTTAWIAVRTTVSTGGTDVDGIRYEITRQSDSSYIVRGRLKTVNQAALYFEAPLPAPTSGTGEWAQLLIVCFEDKVAFFGNGRYITAVSGVPIVKGTIALGVEPNTIVNFANMELRDASPETR